MSYELQITILFVYHILAHNILLLLYIYIYEIVFIDLVFNKYCKYFYDSYTCYIRKITYYVINNIDVIFVFI